MRIETTTNQPAVAEISKGQLIAYRNAMNRDAECLECTPVLSCIYFVAFDPNLLWAAACLHQGLWQAVAAGSLGYLRYCPYMLQNIRWLRWLVTSQQIYSRSDLQNARVGSWPCRSINSCNEKDMGCAITLYRQVEPLLHVPHCSGHNLIDAHITPHMHGVITRCTHVAPELCFFPLTLKLTCWHFIQLFHV